MANATFKLAGTYDADVDVTGLAVGGMVIHRPVFQYMRGTPVSTSATGWAVSHAATGMSLSRMVPKDNRGAMTLTTRKALADWAAQVQARDPEAWAIADKLPFGGGMANEALGQRLHATFTGA